MLPDSPSRSHNAMRHLWNRLLSRSVAPHGRDSTTFCPPLVQLPNFAMAFMGPKANHSRRGSIGPEGVGEFRPPKVGHFHTEMRVQLEWKSSKNFSRRALAKAHDGALETSLGLLCWEIPGTPFCGVWGGDINVSKPGFWAVLAAACFHPPGVVACLRAYRAFVIPYRTPKGA